MVNLHAPFRRAVGDDATAIARLLPPPGTVAVEDAVVAEEDGAVTAALAGHPERDAWRLSALAVAPERLEELGPRLLAISDALAADEGLTAIILDPTALADDLRAMLDSEGFRPAEGGSALWSRPVVPQG